MVSCGVELESEPTLEQVKQMMKIQSLDLPSSPENVNEIILETPTRENHLWAGNGMSTTIGNIRVEKNIVRFDALSHNTIRGAAGGVILLAEFAVKKHTSPNRSHA